MTLNTAPLYGPTPLQKRSGMARISKDHTVLPTHTPSYSQTEWTMRAFAFLAEAGPRLTDPGLMEGWVGLGTAMMSKQSAQDRYMTEITAAVQTVTPRWATGVQWPWASNPWPLEPRRWPLSHRVARQLTMPPSQVDERRHGTTVLTLKELNVISK